MAGSSAGHYTAYTKNPGTDEWHYFNDELVTKQKPQEEDYNNAYVLFYQKQGTPSGSSSRPFRRHLFNRVRILAGVSADVGVSKLLTAQESPQPNIKQLILDLDSPEEQEACPGNAVRSLAKCDF